jgi:tungstate transport system ATP-binding protein
MIESFHLGFSDIHKRYANKCVLEGAEISMSSHDCIVVTGKNGAGKTTLLRIIAGLEKPDSGGIAFDHGVAEPWNRQRKRLLRSVMYLHQQPYMLAGSLQRNIDYAAHLNPALADRATSVARAIRWAGLEGLEAQSAASLSGGQKQRVALTRARLRDPQILLLDEPTANLDGESRRRTLRMLREFRDSGTAIVIVSHDPEVFAELATHRLELRERRVHGTAARNPDVVELDSIRRSKQR